MKNESNAIGEICAEGLAALFDEPFGGKAKGRFRISAKLLAAMAGRRRLYEEDIRDIGRSLLERGYVLIDMESYFVVLSAGTFNNYRRANEQCFALTTRPLGQLS